MRMTPYRLRPMGHRFVLFTLLLVGGGLWAHPAAAQAWTMRAGEHVMSSDSRLFAFTRWVLAHQSHHRGELMIYLRLNDVPLPGIFGPTADEPM